MVEVKYIGEVYDVKNINSSGLEFSPVWCNDELVYVSSREYDRLSLGENNWEKSGYLNIYRAKVKGNVLTDSSRYKPTILFSERLVIKSHTGPICFNLAGDTVFYSQTPLKTRENRKAVLHPQLFMATKKGNAWINRHPLPFNSRNHTFSHPSFDSKTNTLYFVSNMLGGKGGKDIYFSTLKNGIWSSPKNLEHVNSTADELFPHVNGNDIFIASNKTGGKGGLDVYWSNLKSETNLENLESINTKDDDFGLFILPELNKGFMASNRKGNDDIYYVTIEKVVTVKNQLAGRFNYKNLENTVSGLSVMLVGEDGSILFESVTDEHGEFKFNDLDLKEDYAIKVKGKDHFDLFIYDKEGNSIHQLKPDENGEFRYKNLRYGSVGTLTLLPENQKDFNMNFGHLTGQLIYENLPGQYPNAIEVMLVNENNELKYITKTDDRGNFDFRNISLNTNYILKIKDNKNDLTLFIYDKNGNVTDQLKSNKWGSFTYRKLNSEFTKRLAHLTEDSQDEFVIDTRTISGNFNYRNLEGDFKNGLTVYVYSEDGILIADEKTNEKGEFRFRNLPLNDNFLFRIEEDGVLLDMNDFALFLEDRYGKSIAQLQRGENGYFIYKPLGLSVASSLTLLKEDTLSFEYKKSVITNKYSIKKVYFNSNSVATKRGDLSILNAIYIKMKANPKLKLEVNAYADSRSTDKYNLRLSRKRGQWIVDYLVDKGLSKSKFIVNAYGEAQLAVNCEECTDTDNAVNRRAEIRLY